MKSLTGKIIKIEGRKGKYEVVNTYNNFGKKYIQIQIKGYPTVGFFPPEKICLEDVSFTVLGSTPQKKLLW